MNTRIQVEHPVTELVTGIDLVQWQLRVASGEPLAFQQNDVVLRGHAIECRITSEDPRNNFLPSTGRIELLAIPNGPGVRWDGGIETGSEVSLYYDPLLGKLIVYAADRPRAIERMLRALEELNVVGVETSAAFHRRVMGEPDFIAGKLSIRYLEDHPELVAARRSENELIRAALAAALLEDEKASRKSVPRSHTQHATNNWRDLAWQRQNGWRGNGSW
jgi:acetyl-CoA carboxylase biotin carboxylase subunit